MDDLISKKGLLNKINAYVCGSQDKEFICKLIAEMPTKDAVEVVRCKDCIHNQYGFCEKVNHNTGYVSTCADVLRAEKRETDV